MSGPHSFLSSPWTPWTPWTPHQPHDCLCLEPQTRWEIQKVDLGAIEVLEQFDAELEWLKDSSIRVEVRLTVGARVRAKVMVSVRLRVKARSRSIQSPSQTAHPRRP